MAITSLALVAAGCGGGESTEDEPATEAVTTGGTASAQPPATPSAGKSTRLKISADPSGALKFDKSALSARSGTVTIDMDNPAQVPHAVAIEGHGVNVTGQVVNKDGKSTAKAEVKPGKYTFYCPVPGHRQGGMEGTLTVK